MSKRAVLLVNLGSPESTAVPHVRRYLKEFLGDERVIDIKPRWLASIVVNGIIAPTRAPKSAKAYEEIWNRLRVRTGKEAPRLVSFITGPSRTADIEQTIEWGAHGPRRLHVLISDETPS